MELKVCYQKIVLTYSMLPRYCTGVDGSQSQYVVFLG